MLIAKRFNQRAAFFLALAAPLTILFYYGSSIFPSHLVDETIHKFSINSWNSAPEPSDFTGFEHSSAVHNVADTGKLDSHADSSTHHLVGQNEVVDMVDHTTHYLPENTDNIHVLYSSSTSDRKYFSIDFGGASTYNPNIISHPSEPGKYIVIAQSIVYRDDIGSSEEIYCTAGFLNGVLHCPNQYEALPLATSINGDCDDEWAYTNLRRGPRDARAFHGPEAPYIIYGSQSGYTCLGLWIQDLRLLIDGLSHPREGFFRGVTEIQRPEPRAQFEKNYLVFWDDHGNIYAHYDIWPKRAFSQLRHDGTPHSVFAYWIDLALETEEQDQKCMAEHMPKLLDDGGETFHQATNSLRITMCRRSDDTCHPSNSNTFILHIFQRKAFYDGHALYEPYVMLFKQRAPFEIHAIGQKPLWYYGRDKLTEKTQSRLYTTTDIAVDAVMPDNHTEMFYTTSISWAGHNQTYHGYLDDVMFIGIGIEDTRSAGIDVVAEDVVQNLGIC